MGEILQIWTWTLDHIIIFLSKWWVINRRGKLEKGQQTGDKAKFSSVQLLSNILLFVTPWTVAHQASLSFTISWRLLKLTFVEFGDAIQPSHPLSSPSPSTFNLSQHQGLFQWVSSSHQVVKVLELQLQYQSFQWIFRIISFRINGLDLLAEEGTLNSLF